MGYSPPMLTHRSNMAESLVTMASVEAKMGSAKRSASCHCPEPKLYMASLNLRSSGREDHKNRPHWRTMRLFRWKQWKTTTFNGLSFIMFSIEIVFWWYILFLRQTLMSMAFGNSPLSQQQYRDATGNWLRTVGYTCSVNTRWHCVIVAMRECPHRI